MLVLSRKVGERIVVGDSIVITLVKGGDGRARIGIEAPEEMGIYRIDRDGQVEGRGVRRDDERRGATG